MAVPRHSEMKCLGLHHHEDSTKFPRVSIKVSKEVINPAMSAKLLGVTLDDDLKPIK